MFPSGPINLGNPNEISILTLAKMIIELTNSKAKIIYKELPIDDPKRRKPDITYAKDLMDWEPKVSIEKGLQNTIKYFQSILQNQIIIESALFILNIYY